MNIFALDDDPVIAAQFQCDKHVVKMPTETAQLLSTVAHAIVELNERNARRYNELIAEKKIYRVTHFHHPCTKWLLESHDNRAWLVRHGLALCHEYYRRYGHKRGREHAAREVIVTLIREFPFFTGELELHTPFEQCMPEQYRSDNAVMSYREFYRHEKAKFARWTLPATVPDWW